MTGIDPSCIYLWLTLAGLLLGGGLSFIAVPRRRRRPAVFFVLLSLTVLAMLAAFILSGFSLNDLGFRLGWFGAAAALGYICFFFWKAVGVPLLFVFVIGMSILWSSVYDWKPAAAGTEICRFNTISEGAGFIRISYECPDGGSGIDLVDGGRIVPRLKILKLPDYFFVFRERNIYNFEGFAASSVPFLSEEPKFVIRMLLKLPGASAVAAEDSFQVFPSVDYRLVLNDDIEYTIIKFIE